MGTPLNERLDQDYGGCTGKHLETVHGLAIIAQSPTPAEPGVSRPGRCILVDKGEREKFQRYITGWQGSTIDKYGLTRWDPEWSSGHYFVKLSDAALDYEKRIAQWK